MPKLLEEPRDQNERQESETGNEEEDHGVLQVYGADAAMAFTFGTAVTWRDELSR